MRNKSTIFVSVLLLIWVVFTYILLFNQPYDTEKFKNDFYIKYNKLKQQVKNQITINKDLMRDIVQLKDQIKSTSERPPKVKDVREDPVKNYVAQAGEKSPNDKQNKTESSHSDKKRKITLPDGSPIIAVLVLSCNRITVQRCLDQLIKLRPSAEQFPIIVSQDCYHQPTSDVIKSYKEKVLHIQQPDQSFIDIPPGEKKFRGYFKIARHYGWALNQVFVELGYETAIIVEDDLDIAPDFFEYFLGTYPVLVSDKTLWCVSAWNDNGKAELVDENASDLLYRTDFFPGLGWMLTRDLWLELAPKWPKAYWDDWIRRPEHRKNRSCIRPELSRTKTFGKIGVSNGFYYENHLKYIKLNEKFVSFTKMNLSYLSKDNYDMKFVNDVYKSKIVTYSDLKSGNVNPPGPVRIPYHTRQMFKSTARMIGLMDDFRSGVPRTGYRGVISFFYNKCRVYLAPNANWVGYDINWS